MIFLGIDIGVTGAIAAVDKEGRFIAVRDLPIIPFGVWKFADGPGLMRAMRDMCRVNDVHHNARVSIEYAGGMGGPTFGKTAIASLNRVSGAVVASVMIAGYPLELVSPAKWKALFGLTKKREEKIDMKAKAAALARMKFPDAEEFLERAKDHNRAESILLAEYGRRMFSAGGVA